ncbi:MAG: hypothetical protein KDE19_21510 [Caldilineaceae bacterium]|nr:hypothetical protein [Caldilineaceae bacterium]
MLFKEWEMLLVDDEPDVLHVSKLAMQNFEVYGLPLKIHSARSKAEAIAFLHSRPQIHWALAVAFIDVVMEDDAAGLDLCQHIRTTMGNRLTQLFIRTGQPGVAPERTVIDRYDINGYFTKAEATEDKLYSLVKSGVRQYLWARTAHYTITTFDYFLTVGRPQGQLAENLLHLASGPSVALGKTPTYLAELPSALLVGDKVILASGWDEQQARSMRNQLDQLPGTPLSAEGDKYVRDENTNQFIKVAARAGKPAIYWQFKTAFMPPLEIIELFYRSAKAFALTCF